MSIKDLRKRADQAWGKRKLYDAMLRDVYDYVLPMRAVAGLQTAGGKPEADIRVDKVFDATAVKAAFRFAGRIQTELTPIFQEFFALEAGPLLPAGEQKKTLNEAFQAIGDTVNGVLASGSYHNSSHEAYVDLYGGTCHILVHEGDEHDLVRFQVVPVPEVAIEDGPFGQVEHWYWKREYRADELQTVWPKGTFGEDINKQIETDGSKPVAVWQYTYFDRKAGDYKLVVWTEKCSDSDKPIWQETFRTSPWITARFFKVPGEAYGRGPAQLAMPFIKTANKTRELQLKAAAFALMGLWAYKNDGVFNPNVVKFEPRAMWAVTSTGGPMGATLQRLPVPQDFDISGVIMADEREQMKQALFDDTLPAEQGAVKSATEIAERIRRLSQDLSGVYGRLTLEIVAPLVIRVIDILERKGKLKTSLKIDQLITRVRVIAPIASGQQAAKVQAVAHWGEIVGLLGGPNEFRKVARTEDLFPEIGRWLGIQERHIRSAAERKKLDDDEKRAVQTQQAAVLAKAAPDGPSPAGQIVNGGMM